MMHTRILSLLGVAALLLAGCTSNTPTSRLKLETDGIAFKQSELQVAAGEPVKLELINGDSLLHDFSIDKIPVKVTAETHEMHKMAGMNPDLHVSAAAGKTGTITFTALEPGTYTYYCTVAGHREAGMEGRLIVK